MKEQLKILKKHILTGTSHMIPFIVAGGILFSLAVMLNPAGAATPETGWLAGLAQIGLGGLTLFVPVLGGYIAYSIADKPGLAPGMIGAYLAKEMGAGFLGGMAAGLIAGVVVKELKSFDEEEEEKGFFGIFKKASNKIESMKAKYAKAESNVNEIVKVLEKHQVQLMKDTALLDKMYDLNLTYFKELSMYILAGKKKLLEVRNTQLAELLKKAEISGLPEDAQAAKDLDSMCNRFEKKIHDLELTRMISIQTAPQIRLVQNNDTLMVEKIQSTIVNTIPLWKSQMVLALGVEHSAQAAAAQREVTDMTNQLLRKNAEKLKMATIDTAKESERGIVDMETLKATNESLISTLDEVMNIQREGRQKRAEAEEGLRNMEQELKAKLLEIQG